ncbi:MAG: glycerol-3-phosphate dehydrogenase/oxidase [Pseudomonadota bacterium]
MSQHWDRGWRAALPAQLAREYDLLIIGGGITGAGILLEASRRGLKALLVEQRDFAWGTSSRSSKLVHGGLRYLKQGRVKLTREAVRERQALLRDAPGLVQNQGFAFADHALRKPGRALFLVGLALYDLLAGRRERHYYGANEFLMLAPNVGRDGLRGGMCYTDAKTDDARLVLRVLQEARAHGGVAVNYLRAKTLLRDGGKVCGAILDDVHEGGPECAGRKYEVRARLVINATGAWADALRGQTGAVAALRPLRGSHLVLPAWRLPLSQAVSLMHPADGRPVFAFPWEGVTLVGTTDVDHADGLANEASITRAEFDYLLAALHAQFPQMDLGEHDVIATYAGVRPVIDSGAGDPSEAGREHALWLDDGMLTISGGKLTTFRVIALDVLRRAMPLLPGWHDALKPLPIFGKAAAPVSRTRVAPSLLLRLRGRHGAQARALLDAAGAGELDPIAGTETVWAELRWAARAEAVLRLEDLMLRRTRLGLQLRGGGVGQLARIRAICQPELGWDDQRWDAEQAAYLALWNAHYGLPPQA